MVSWADSVDLNINNSISSKYKYLPKTLHIGSVTSIPVFNVAHASIVSEGKSTISEEKSIALESGEQLAVFDVRLTVTLGRVFPPSYKYKQYANGPHS